MFHKEEITLEIAELLPKNITRITRTRLDGCHLLLTN